MASTSACTVAGGLGEDRLHEEDICMLQSSDVVVTGGRVRAPRPQRLHLVQRDHAERGEAARVDDRECLRVAGARGSGLAVLAQCDVEDDAGRNEHLSRVVSARGHAKREGDLPRAPARCPRS
jgi:hypothetical protein